MQVNYEDFYRVTPDEAVALVDRLARGDEVRSVRGQKVQTAREISYEIAVTGAYRPQRKTDTVAPSEATAPQPQSQAKAAEMPAQEQVAPGPERKDEARLVGGVTLPADLAPGWRPREEGDTDDGGRDDG